MAAILANLTFCGSPDYMVRLTAFIFGSDMHLYWGYTHTWNYAAVENIFEIINFLKKNHISHLVPLCIMYFEIHITMNYLCVACIYTYFNGNYFIGWFGIYADEPMQLWIVCHVASCIIVIGIIVCVQSSQPQVWLQKLHILHIYMYICPLYMHMY